MLQAVKEHATKAPWLEYLVENVSGGVLPAEHLLFLDRCRFDRSTFFIIDFFSSA